MARNGWADNLRIGPIRHALARRNRADNLRIGPIRHAPPSKPPSSRRVAGARGRAKSYAPGALGAILSEMKLFTRKSPWYTAGLAFECSGCGTCCAGPDEGYVWVTNDEISSIAEHLGIPRKEMMQKYVRKVRSRYSLIERTDNRDCIFLNPDPDGGKGCSVYSVRPTQCRTWPFWPANLRNSESWILAGLRCKGINRGQLHECEQIEAAKKATDRR